MNEEYVFYNFALGAFGWAPAFWGNLHTGGDDPVTIRARQYVPNAQDMAETIRIAEKLADDKRNSKREQRRRRGKKGGRRC